MTPREKALIVRADQERKALELIEKKEIEDAHRANRKAQELMHKALSGKKDVTYIIDIKKEDADRITQLLIFNGFTEKNFWKIRVETFRDKDCDFHDYESTSISLDVIYNK